MPSYTLAKAFQFPRWQESPDMNKNDAIDVVVFGNCGSGKYCSGRKIDKPEVRTIGDKGIDQTKVWPSLGRRSRGYPA